MGICSFGRQFWASFGGSRVYGDLQALVGSDGPRLVGAVYGDLQALVGSSGLWGFAALIGSSGPRLVGAVSMGICSFGRQFWTSFGGSRVYGDLQLWSAVMGLVWWEPCLWGFAALIGSSRVYGICSFGRPRLVGAVCVGICSFGRQVGAVSLGICSFGRQLWASFGGSRVYRDLQLWLAFAALVGSDGPRLVGAVSMRICSFNRQFWASFGGSRVYEICSFGRQFWASFGGSRVYGDLQLWSGVVGLVWWEPCLWGFAALVGSSGPRLVGALSVGMCS